MIKLGPLNVENKKKNEKEKRYRKELLGTVTSASEKKEGFLEEDCL